VFNHHNKTVGQTLGEKSVFCPIVVVRSFMTSATEFIVWNVVSGYKSYANLSDALTECRNKNCKVIFSPHHNVSFVRRGSTDHWRQLDSRGRYVGRLLDLESSAPESALESSPSAADTSRCVREAIDPEMTMCDECVGVRHCFRRKPTAAACCGDRRCSRRNTICPSRLTRVSPFGAGWSA
jgi:hypothetical protein